MANVLLKFHDALMIRAFYWYELYNHRRVKNTAECGKYLFSTLSSVGKSEFPNFSFYLLFTFMYQLFTIFLLRENL